MNSSAFVANKTCFPSTFVWPAILFLLAVKETPLFVMFQCGRAFFCIDAGWWGHHYAGSDRLRNCLRGQRNPRFRHGDRLHTGLTWGTCPTAGREGQNFDPCTSTTCVNLCSSLCVQLSYLFCLHQVPTLNPVPCLNMAEQRQINPSEDLSRTTKVRPSCNFFEQIECFYPSTYQRQLFFFFYIHCIVNAIYKPIAYVTGSSCFTLVWNAIATIVFRSIQKTIVDI